MSETEMAPRVSILMALLSFFAMVIPSHKLLCSTITVASVPITGFIHNCRNWDVNALGSLSMVVLLFLGPFHR